MKSEPLVSIIVPSYNQGRFLEETLQSVLSQDYSKLEVIVIDGGSTDESVEIIRRYEDRITYWESEPDRGQSHAINKGFARSSGEIVNWLCSDDVLLAGAVSRVVEAFRSHPAAAAVLGHAVFTDEDSKVLGPNPASYPGYPDLIRFWNCRVSIPQPAFFLHRRLIEKSDHFLAEKYHHAMDYEFWCRTLAGEEVVSLDVPLATYRRHAAAKTTASDKWRDEKRKISRRHWGPVASPGYWCHWGSCHRAMSRVWSHQHWSRACEGRDEGLRVRPLVSLARSLFWRPMLLIRKNFHTLWLSILIGERHFAKWRVRGGRSRGGL